MYSWTGGSEDADTVDIHSYRVLVQKDRWSV